MHAQDCFYPEFMEIRLRSARIAGVLLAAASLMEAATAAAADRCADLARPAVFDEHTAMAAIFCEYDRARGGTLLPVEHTKSWDLARAEYLAGVAAKTW